MKYWLLKSEPETWSWQDQVSAGVDGWDGVCNYQASNYMKLMQIGDRAFFYHSGKQKAIVGVVEIVKTAYPDESDQRFMMVDVKALLTLPFPVTLQSIKGNQQLGHLMLVKQPRLSVMPVDALAWQIICEMGGC